MPKRKARGIGSCRPNVFIFGVLLALLAVYILEVNGRPPRQSICKTKFNECMAKSTRHTRAYCDNAMSRRYNCKTSVNRGLGPGADSDESDPEFTEESTTTTTKKPDGLLGGVALPSVG